MHHFLFRTDLLLDHYGAQSIQILRTFSLIFYALCVSMFHSSECRTLCHFPDFRQSCAVLFCDCFSIFRLIIGKKYKLVASSH